MNTALVKIDVAAADLGLAVRRIEQMFEGRDLTTGSLVWVFDFAKSLEKNARRVPRFWRPELLAVASGDGALRGKYVGFELDWVIDKILPVNRSHFHAGEVDQLFQIRHNTRKNYPELNGTLRDGRNYYERATLVAFLKRRWLGAVYERAMNEARVAAPEPEVQSLKFFPPRAAATTSADNTKQTTHAAN